MAMAYRYNCLGCTGLEYSLSYGLEILWRRTNSAGGGVGDGVFYTIGSMGKTSQEEKKGSRGREAQTRDQGPPESDPRSQRETRGLDGLK